jgi:hypothetical protein
MKKYILLFVLVVDFSISIFAQKKSNKEFFKTFSIGNSVTYIWDGYNDKDNPNSPKNYSFKEYTWNINFSVSLSKRFSSGIQALNIFTSGSRIDNSYSYIYGVFLQYDFLGKTPSPVKFFLESSINKGNYFTGGSFDPYTREGLNYFGYGAGFDIPLRNISKKLFIDLSFYNYIILNDIIDKYNYTQYIIGINYYIGKRVSAISF